ncbi:MAG TPA: hypothetical protein VJZ78_05950 [Anaerolineales bacterium]|nr:hypothetical protein [Anaerolineales bacterium]
MTVGKLVSVDVGVAVEPEPNIPQELKMKGRINQNILLNFDHAGFFINNT